MLIFDPTPKKTQRAPKLSEPAGIYECVYGSILPPLKRKAYSKLGPHGHA